MSLVRIQKDDFSVTDEIERIKASSKSIGGIVAFLGTGRDISKGEEIVSVISPRLTFSLRMAKNLTVILIVSIKKGFPFCLQLAHYRDSLVVFIVPSLSI